MRHGVLVRVSRVQHFRQAEVQDARFIVCADANIERTAAALTWGSMANAGQSCLSIERVYVAREIESFERTVSPAARQGNGVAPANVLG